MWLGKMELTGIDQLWVADITYIRLEREFVYLAVEAVLVLTALRRALEERQPCPGLVHHSDRGVQ